MRGFLKEIERLKPTRVVLDSLAELRLLAGSALRYRRHVLALKQFFTDRRVTAPGDRRSQLERGRPARAERRPRPHRHAAAGAPARPGSPSPAHRRSTVRPPYRGGWHDFVIRRGGLEVFQRLDAADHRVAPESRRVASGLPTLDALFGGGVETGTSTLLTGAPRHRQVHRSPRSS
jgi:circadian clock protein KaiC